MIAQAASAEEALELAKRLLSDPKNALDVLARDELGLNPDDLGSPWVAAASSLLSFAAGAVVPLIPFLFAEGSKALVSAVMLTAVALFGVGAVISLFTGKSAFSSGFRMLAIGALAGAVTYGIGSVFGVSLA